MSAKTVKSNGQNAQPVVRQLPKNVADFLAIMKVGRVTGNRRCVGGGVVATPTERASYMQDQGLSPA